MNGKRLLDFRDSSVTTLKKSIPIIVLCVAVVSSRASAQNAPAPEPTTPAGQTRLGNTYLDKKDYASAMTWFRKAAEKNEPAAQNNLGWLYENGFGFPQDYAEAMRWFVKSANQGNAEAQNNIGWLYYKGWGVKQDYAEAMKWYRKAAEHASMKAQVNVGWLYANGFGVQQDYSEAMTWYLQAADKGNAQAQNNMGWLYENGLGVTQDFAEARAWYYQAAAQGNVQAETNLAKLYQDGHGITQDYAAAMTWYLKAADQGDAKAQNGIGWLYQNGLGVPKDYAEATKWYQKAAAQGDSTAKANLEWVSRVGSSGVIKEILPTAQKNGSVTLPSEKQTEPAIVLPGGIHAPRAIYSPDPEYSEQARKAKYSGEVLLSLVVDPDGLPRDIKVLAPLGDGLDEKAVEAVKTWKFEPGTKDGKPVAVQLMIEVTFRLYGELGENKEDGVAKVETVGTPKDSNFNSFLSPVIAEAGKCWSKSVQDKAHPPSLQQGQVTVKFTMRSNGRVDRAEIASSSGDDALDRAARDCVATLKTGKPLPAEPKELFVRMKFLHNEDGVALTPNGPRIMSGARVQFNLSLAGESGQAATWIVMGAGCAEAACGTISPDGLYIAPDVLPDPPYVRVKAMLAGANPMVASTIVALEKAR